jgi:ATHILA ORF-1 family
MEDDRRVRYIKFILRGTTQRVTLDQFREWFHLHLSPQIDESAYKGEMTGEDIFEMISRRGVGRQEEFKSKLIIHPILCCIQKIIDHTIYARDESIIRVIHEDLQMIDIILLSDYELQRPDLMLCMLCDWLGLRTNPKSTDMITMESYMTYIGHKLGLQFIGDDIYKIPLMMNDKSLRASYFIRISRRLPGRGSRYYWIFVDMSE